MDPVDIEDHHRVMNACVLHSWKWTWSPVLLMFDTIKTNCYTLHVLLCADFNEFYKLEHDHADYLRPHEPSQFYRILGLKMMKYRCNAGYWFEPKRTTVAVVPQNDDLDQPDQLDGAAAATVAAATNSPAKVTRKHRSVAGLRASSGKRFDGALQHARSETKLKTKGTCNYCGKRHATFYTCGDCGVPLHYPTGANQWPCAARYHSARSTHRKYCYGDFHKNKKQGSTQKFQIDPDVAKMAGATICQQTSPPTGRRTFEVHQAPNPEPRRVRARTTNSQLQIVAVATPVPDS
jgi:LSD1 subclass zinc finger protein